MTAVIDHRFDRVRAARSTKGLGAAAATAFAGIFYGLGWVAARSLTGLWAAVAWSIAAVKVGWADGGRRMAAQPAGKR